jgi:hypothetical protein
MFGTSCFKAICLENCLTNAVEVFLTTQGTCFDTNCRTWIHLGMFPFMRLTKHINYLHMANHTLVRFDI